MLKDIVQVHPLGDYRLYIRFEDGVEGKIDIEKITNFSGIFAPLKDENFLDRSKLIPIGGQSFGRTGLI